MNKYSLKDILEKDIFLINEGEEPKAVLLDKIEIPKIQRDYAQGRMLKSESEVRRRLLDNIFETLTEVQDVYMDMDFVYGSIDDRTKIFLPLDGQQRLTTLFLLYWYIGSRELKSEKLTALKQVLGKFTYETRSSSRLFCEKLNSPEAEIEFDDLPSVKIMNLSWFYQSYKQDPTVKSMLNMLDAIHEKYLVSDEKLFGNLERLQFYILPLNGFNLSDELYVKMNARGKQLTGFENFKADLIKWMKDENNSETKLFTQESVLNNRSMPYYIAFTQKVDTIWTHYFWKETKQNLIDPSGKIVDPLFFRLFYRYFFSKLVIREVSFKETILEKLSDTELYDKYKVYITKKLENESIDSVNSLKESLGNNPEFGQNFIQFIYDKHYYALYEEDDYRNFEVFKKIGSYDILSRFERALDTLHTHWQIIHQSVQPSWQREAKEARRSFKILMNQDINQSERVVLLAVILFLEKESSFDEIGFKQWIRIVWNIVENTDIDGHRPMIATMKLVLDLFNKSQKALDIYKFLAQQGYESLSSKEAVAEECNKAKFIVYNDSRWEDLFINAESHPFFRGSVGFIITDEMSQDDFIHRTKLAFSVFDDKGVNQLYKTNGHIFLRALISQYTNYSHIIERNFTDTDEKEHYLKKMLANDEVVRNSIREWFLKYDEDELMNALKEMVEVDSVIGGWHTSNESETVITRRAHEALYKTPDLQRWMQKKGEIRFAWRWDGHIYVSKPRAWYDWIMLDTNRNEIISSLVKEGCYSDQQATFHKNEENIPIPYFTYYVVDLYTNIGDYNLKMTFSNDNIVVINCKIENTEEYKEIKSYNYVEEYNNDAGGFIKLLKKEVLNDTALKELINT